MIETNNWRVVHPSFRASCPNLAQAHMLAARTRGKLYNGTSPVRRIEKAWTRDGGVNLRAWWSA